MEEQTNRIVAPRIAARRSLHVRFARARYIMLQPSTAEVAFAVVDEFQGQGIGTTLIRHLTLLARKAGLKDLVLPENAAMLKVFEKKWA